MGERHGAGIMTYADGGQFEGTFALNKRAGPNCALTMADGSEYRGDFFDDKMHGDGVMVSPCLACRFHLGDVKLTNGRTG